MTEIRTGTDAIEDLIGYKLGEAEKIIRELGYPQFKDIILLRTAPPRSEDRSIHDELRILRVSVGPDNRYEMIVG